MGETEPSKDVAPSGKQRPRPPESSIDRIIELYKRDVDRTLLREQLRKTPDERVRELVDLERFAEVLRGAARISWQGD